MFTKKNNAFLELECQEPAKKKLAELTKMPIRGIKKLILISFGSNGLTRLLRRFQLQIMQRKKLGDAVMFFGRESIHSYNQSHVELLEDVFHFCNPKVIIVDDFQLYYEYTKFWRKIDDLVSKSRRKNILIIAGMNCERIYEKETLSKIANDFETLATITKPTTSDIVKLSESILTDYNPISDLKYQLNLDVKALVNEIEREAGYPSKISYK